MQIKTATSHMISTSDSLLDIENTNSLHGELIRPALKLIFYCTKHNKGGKET